MLVACSVEKQRWTGDFWEEKQIKWPECRGNKGERVLESSLERKTERLKVVLGAAASQ